MRKKIVALTFLFALSLNLLAAPTATAQETFPGIASFAGCSGPDCSACNVVDMVNEGLVWLIGILFILFAVLVTIAGVKLVTSGGNPGALNAAKSSFINALVGMIIILSAWLIVDTIMRGLVGGIDENGNSRPGEIGVVQGGRVTGWLAWSEVECQVQEEPQYNEIAIIDQSQSTCTVIGTTYGGDPIFDCTIQLQQCTDRGGIGVVDTSSAISQRVECTVTSGAVTEGTTYSLSTPGGPVPVTACDTASLTTVSFLGRSVTVHRNVASSLGRINARWSAAGGSRFYPIREMGSYACRTNVNDPSRQSWHAYGLAIDINATANPNTSKQTPCPSDMPSEFVSMLTSEGWGWGGSWNSLCDAMHFSKAINEDGNMAGD